MSVLTADEAQVLLGEAGRRPADATRVLEPALMLREALYDLFAAVARGVPPPPVAVDTLNVALADAAAQARFVPTVDSLTWAWLDRKDSLDTMLWPVARSAVDLLTAAERRRLRECPGSPGKACGWLFVDTSKNRSRRWCVTGLCGNRARAHRHYHRRQGARQPTHDT